VASVDVLLTDMVDFGDFKAPYQKYFPGISLPVQWWRLRRFQKGDVLRLRVWLAGRLLESDDGLIKVLV
jgi:hypothetical protein